MNIIHLPKLIAMTTMIAAGVLSAWSQENAPGEFAGQTDIGAPELTGGATYDATEQSYTVSGAGSNMWFDSDQCHFVWKKIKGDFILRTRMEFVGTGTNAHRKGGWLIRPNLDPSAPYADCAEHGSGLTSLQYRPVRGANTEEVTLAITNADVLQFEQKGTEKKLICCTLLSFRRTFLCAVLFCVRIETKKEEKFFSPSVRTCAEHL